MAAGDVTVTVVGTYSTMALAVAGATGQNLPAATDRIEIVELEGIGPSRFAVLKFVRA